MESPSDHLRREHYDAARSMQGGPGLLGRRMLDHLSQRCADCRQYFRQLGRLQDELFRRLDDLELVPDDPPDGDPWEWSATEADLEAQEAETAEMRRQRRRAWEEKSKLLRAPPSRRPGKIRGAWRRFQSRLLAEELVDEAQKHVRSDPAQAAEILSLMPHVLRSTGPESGPGWAWALAVQSQARRANALRIAGDLRGADEIFATLHGDLVERPVGEAATAAEVASLEASLRTAQHRFEAAEEILKQAALLYTAANDRRGRAKVEIQRASLLRRTGEPERNLEMLKLAASRLDPSEEPFLFLCTVTGRVNALCDLGRPAAAGRLLERHLDLYEATDDPHSGATFRALRGRIALEQGEHATAEDSLQAAQDGFLDLGRKYDAALAALDLARAYLEAGKTGEVRRLATGLVDRFAALGVADPLLQTFRLLAQSATADRLSVALVLKVRARVEALSVSAPPDPF